MTSASGSAPGPSGLALIDKPAGITSHDAVDRVRRALGTRKVGHAGTLDPMATGLLVMGVGRATRLLRFIGELPKRYVGTAILGVETDTLDAQGAVVRTAPQEEVDAVTVDALRSAMGALTGPLEQVPPAYSAVRIGGERLYRAARRGEQVDAPPRRVRVEAFELLAFEPPRFDFEVRCSGGTYVRSLIRDVGARLGPGAHLSALRREAIGPFDVADAFAPDAPSLLPSERAVAHLPGLTLHPEEARVARHGSILGPAGVAGPYRVHDPNGLLIGIYRDDGPKGVPEVILA